MKYLFEEDNKRSLTIAPYVSYIKEFADMKKNLPNDEFFRELSAVFFFADKRSPYAKFTEDERINVIKNDIFFGYPDWQPSDLFMAAIKKYEELSFTPSMLSLSAADAGIKAYRDYLNTVDLLERDEKGKNVHDPAKVKTMIMDLPKLMRSRKELEDVVMSDINESQLLMGDREKAPFEDPDSHMG